MRIIRQAQDSSPEKWKGYHILTVAEAGFSMLDIYARGQHYLDKDVIRQFADRVNSTDESGSLHPRAPVSAIPRRFLRDYAASYDPELLADFRRHIAEFIEANRATIHAARVLVDFHVSASPVPQQYVTATEKVFRNRGQSGPIEEVVILT